jgi:hypothetical protein
VVSNTTIVTRNGRKYVPAVDPRTQEQTEGRIEGSPSRSGRVIISFPPCFDS